MPLAVIATLILIMKIAEVGPPADWSWIWVLLPFAVLFVWWEFISKAIGWDKKQAEAKMKKEQKEAQETKKKNRGF